MTYYDALVAEWPSLSGTTQEKLDAINTLMVPGPSVPVPVLKVMTYLRTNNLWMAIKASVSPGAQAAVDYNEDPRVQTIDLSLPVVQGMLADLAAHSLLTLPQIGEIIALGKTSVTWWAANGYARPFDLGDIEAAGLT